MGSGVLKAKVGGQWVPIIGSGMSAEVARWNSAWGVVATASLTATNLPTDTAVTVASLSFQTVAGRRYRVAFAGRAVAASAACYVRINLLVNGTPVSGSEVLKYLPSTHYEAVLYEWLLSGDGLTKTFTIRCTVIGASATIYGEPELSRFYVEDVGPVTPSAVAPPNPTPAWTNATLQNSWVNVSSSTFTSARYRLNGDRVEVEGLVGGGAYSVAIFTLPAGYRPSKNFVFTCFGSGANGAVGAFRVDVQPDGTVLVQAAAAGTTGPPSYMTLTGIQFSIT